MTEDHHTHTVLSTLFISDGDVSGGVVSRLSQEHYLRKLKAFKNNLMT